MTTSVSATFEVKDWNEEPFDDIAKASKVTRAKVTKTYAGDIDGESFTEWLMAYREDGTATFVGLERISGRVSGKNGTFVLQHDGSFENGAARADLRVLEGSGSGELTGITGEGDFVADPAGKVNLQLTLP
jgi:hypothetical protein